MKKGILLVVGCLGCLTLIVLLVVVALPAGTILIEKISQGGLSGGEKAVVIPDNWKTYTNSVNKLEFSYPGNWSFEVARDDPQMLSVIVRLEDESQEKMNVYGEMMTPFYDIGIMVNPNPEGLSARQWYLNQFGEGSKGTAAEKIETLTVGGVEAIKYAEPTAPASGPSTAILVGFNGRMYSFVYSAVAYKETHEKYLADFDLILDSVKFLK